MSDIKTQLQIPTATMQKNSSAFSIVWIIPLVTAIIGGWLVFNNAADESTLVNVTFQHAHGIEKEKTLVKYRDIKVGTVKEIRFSSDLLHVVVVLQIDGINENRLTEFSRFWVVKPRVSTNGVSGLETLMSGSYIELDPGEEGEVSREFIGLEEPPHNQLGSEGTIYNIHADSLGSLTAGSPVHYRGLNVGKVIKYKLAEDRSHLEIKIFVDAPHDKFVRSNTRFWNTSGVKMEVGAEGLKMKVESMVALLVGGLSFDTPESIGNSDAVAENAIFTLYKTQIPEPDEITSFTVPFLMYFTESVRGLSVGSPVEFGGVRVGSVADISLDADFSENEIRIPVLVKLEPDLIPLKQLRVGENVSQRTETTKQFIRMVVSKGMRAQLETSSLLTGKLSIVVNMYPGEKEVTLQEENGYTIIPTVPGALTSLTSQLNDSLNNLNNLLHKLDSLPLKSIAQNFDETMAGANKLFNDKNIALSVKSLNETLDQVNVLINSISADEVGALNVQARVTMDELAKAARSLRAMAEYLERHPESLLKGKR